MDLHLIPGQVASDAERAAIDAALAGLDADAGPGRRHLLLPLLNAAQAHAGWISEGALNHICERLQVPPAEAYGVASFYALIHVTPRPTRVVHVCDDIACRTHGAEALCEALAARLGTSGPEVPWVRSPCLGHCDRAPVAFVQEAGEGAANRTINMATEETVVAAIGGASPRSAPMTSEVHAAGTDRRLLARVGRVSPESLDAYRGSGGYAALRLAIALGPDGILREMHDSGLVGRGGAAFPLARKWEAVARSPLGPHYLVCNADESEPGTFKDRVLMEEDPFSILEAMTIAGLATNCELGFVYVRGEYPLAISRMRNAVAAARSRGLLGVDILGHGLRFDVELRVGAGAYICGEETALFNSIEGFRGEPRNKPPFPVQAGLFGKPTVVNNVETLANVPLIVREGGRAFARVGTAMSTGTKLFCVSGSVARPGLYEVPFGLTLRELIAEGGGVAGGRALQAVLIGGAAGVFLRPDELDMPLTFEGAREAGASLGSGVVMLFDDRVDLAGIVRRIAAFFRDESCGQCVPCRVGTVRQEEAIARLAARGDQTRERALIDDLALAMRDASICGLGHTASTAVQSALEKFALFA